MKKKGFTLVELLGVLIILSALVLVVFPSILNQVKKSQGKISDSTKMLIETATNLYLNEHKNIYGMVPGDVYCITLDTLVKDEKLDASVKKYDPLDFSHYVKVTLGSERSYEIVESCTEINTTPSSPKDPDVIPGTMPEQSNGPTIEFLGSNFLSKKATSFNALENVIITDDKTPMSEITVHVVGSVSLGVVGDYLLTYEAIDGDSNVTTKSRIIKVIETEYTYAQKSEAQEFQVPYDGDYRFELWGAQGGNYSNRGYVGGRGSYVAGTISLQQGEVLYLFIGSQGAIIGGGYNGGGTGGSYTTSGGTWSYGGGGGSTDVRTDYTNVNSRIMVAGAGGGASWYSGGGEALSLPSAVGTFYSGTASSKGGGGGSGYYGGGAGSTDYGGGGGSSYISGHPGSVAITSASDTTLKSGCTMGTADPTCSYHYTNRIFTDTVMKGGVDTTIPTYDGTGVMTGNAGNGYAKITIVNVE